MTHKHVAVCIGQPCTRFGSRELLRDIHEAFKDDADVEITTHPCLGYCSSAPNVQIGDELLPLATAKGVARRVRALQPHEHHNDTSFGQCCGGVEKRSGVVPSADDVLRDNDYLGDL